MLKTIPAFCQLIKSGKGLSDKVIIFRYFIFCSISSLLPRTIRNKIKVFDFITKDITISTKHGEYSCRAKTDDLLICGKEDYEDKLNGLFDVVNGGVFIDVGAHIGRYTVQVARKEGVRVISIEPQSQNFQMLQKNISLNNLKDVISLNCAVYKIPKVLKFYISNHPGLHSIYQKTNKCITVKSDTLNNIVKRFKLERVDLVKIDVEDAELDVLKGSDEVLLKFKPKIIFECRSLPAIMKIRKYLVGFDYNISEVMEHNYVANHKKEYELVA